MLSGVTCVIKQKNEFFAKKKMSIYQKKIYERYLQAGLPSLKVAFVIFLFDKYSSYSSQKTRLSQRQLLLKFDYRGYATNRSYLHWISIRTALLKQSYNRRYKGYKASTSVRKK